ncbi:hypothetical protein G1C95_2407 [Bifidobacterium sp. DSM 109957]|uniref:Uncharacterized protein n=1 Tax=Bifidobacterium oedipodis TaxID=2675322 RepID=A0A7Y0ERR2_9BIFI|nr:hypothetical protein [Bifidobacterium sp. DSM 109957]
MFCLHSEPEQKSSHLNPEHGNDSDLSWRAQEWNHLIEKYNARGGEPISLRYLEDGTPDKSATPTSPPPTTDNRRDPQSLNMSEPTENDLRVSTPPTQHSPSMLSQFLSMRFHYAGKKRVLIVNSTHNLSAMEVAWMKAYTREKWNGREQLLFFKRIQRKPRIVATTISIGFVLKYFVATPSLRRVFIPSNIEPMEQ